MLESLNPIPESLSPKLRFEDRGANGGPAQAWLCRASSLGGRGIWVQGLLVKGCFGVQKIGSLGLQDFRVRDLGYGATNLNPKP